MNDIQDDGEWIEGSISIWAVFALLGAIALIVFACGGLVALVFCLARPTAPGSGRGSLAGLAAAQLIDRFSLRAIIRRFGSSCRRTSGAVPAPDASCITGALALHVPPHPQEMT